MADKTIGELPAISTLSDTAMLPVEQNGAAGRISGSQWRQYAVDTVSPYVATATQAAGDAEDAASLASQRANAAASSAASASDDAAAATDAKNAIINMGVAANTLLPDVPASVTKTESGGVVTLTFGIPRGTKGDTGDTGPRGEQGVQGPKGDTGTAVAVETSGLYYFNVDNDSESETFGHLFLTYTGNTAPDFSINENGHLIWTVEEEGE